MKLYPRALYEGHAVVAPEYEESEWKQVSDAEWILTADPIEPPTPKVITSVDLLAEVYAKLMGMECLWCGGGDPDEPNECELCALMDRVGTFLDMYERSNR